MTSESPSHLRFEANPQYAHCGSLGVLDSFVSKDVLPHLCKVWLEPNPNRPLVVTTSATAASPLRILATFYDHWLFPLAASFIQAGIERSLCDTRPSPTSLGFLGLGADVPSCVPHEQTLHTPCTLHGQIGLVWGSVGAPAKICQAHVPLRACKRP